MIKADCVYLNGVIYTMASEDETVEAMAVLNGKIVFIGTTEEARKLATRNVVDLEGKTVVPGFTDTHMHLMMDCEKRMKVDLLNATSIEEIISLMKIREKEERGTDGWLMGSTLHVEKIKEGRFPTRYELDQISTTRPIIITSYCLHTAMVNSKALEMAKIGKGFKPEVEGTIDMDENDEPIGIVRETAYKSYIEPLMNVDLSDEEFRKELVRSQAETYSSMGITTFQTYSALGDELAEYLYTYKELDETGELPFRVIVNTAAELPKSVGLVSGMGSDKIKYGAKKIFSDGSLNSRSAALMEPYSDAPDETGILLCSQEELTAQIKEAYDYGMDVAIHTIGDLSMEMVLNGIETAVATATKKTDARFRIIHAMVVQEQQIMRMKKLPVILDLQPVFLRNWGDALFDRIGTERAKLFIPMRKYIDEGLIITGGSDAPVEDVNPLIGIQCAVTRKSLEGKPENGLIPEQAITVYEAVCMFTKNAAYCTHEENIKGTIELGKLADFVVLDQDIFKVNIEEIHNIKVLKTVLDGDIVYSREV